MLSSAMWSVHFPEFRGDVLVPSSPVNEQSFDNYGVVPWVRIGQHGAIIWVHQSLEKAVRRPGRKRSGNAGATLMSF